MARTHIPTSTSTVTINIINVAVTHGVPIAPFFSPDVAGFERLSATSYSFLITHHDAPSNRTRRLLFDLGRRRDWENYVPSLVSRIKGWGADIQQGPNVADVLIEHGVALEDIEAVVWSHAHWDHTGDPSTFPPSTHLIVGPGTKEAFLPGWPTRPEAPVLASAFNGRTVNELSFDDSDSVIVIVGGMRAIDYFGDGSFYLLDAPGHAVGNLNALVRTSAGAAAPNDEGDDDDTFMLLAGDDALHGSQLRPSPHLPLPTPSISLPGFTPDPCPVSLFEALHADACTTEPLMQINPGKSSMTYNVADANETLRKVQAFDADDRVLVVIAHDYTLLEVVDFFPKEANGWKAKGWKEEGRWGFLRDFQRAVEIVLEKERKKGKHQSVDYR